MDARYAIRRYNRAVIGLSLIYATALIGATHAFRHQMIAGPVAYAVAILPALPIVAIFAAMGRYLVEEQDEYVRMLTVRQTLWATGIMLSAATIWGFLESFGLASHIPAYYISVLWFAGLGAGSCINRMTLGRRS